MDGEMMIFDAKIGADAKDAVIKELREENRKLSRALADANVRAERAQEDAAQALTALRRQLTPLYRALQAVFGELDAAGGIGDDARMPTENQPTQPDSRTAAVWASWKERLGAGPAKCIDALLLHNDLNTQQLSIATGYHRNNIPGYIHKLHKAGLIDKNGNRFSLKKLP